MSSDDNEFIKNQFNDEEVIDEDILLSDEAKAYIDKVVNSMLEEIQQIIAQIDSLLLDIKSFVDGDKDSSGKLNEKFVAYKIQIGIKLNDLDELLGSKFETWKDKVKDFGSEQEIRSFQIFKRLARNNIDKNYYWLGIECLDGLATVAEKEKRSINDIVKDFKEKAESDGYGNNPETVKKFVHDYIKYFKSKLNLEKVQVVFEESKLLDVVKNMTDICGIKEKDAKSIKDEVDGGRTIDDIFDSIANAKKYSPPNTSACSAKTSKVNTGGLDPILGTILTLSSDIISGKIIHERVELYLLNDAINSINKLKELWHGPVINKEQNT